MSPVILGVSGGAGKYMTGFKTVAAMVRAMDDLGITVPVALHLDHGAPMRAQRPALKLALPPSCSMAPTTPSKRTLPRPVSWLAWHTTRGLSIEAVGSIGGVEDGVVGNGEIADLKSAKITASMLIPWLLLPHLISGPDLEALERNPSGCQHSLVQATISISHQMVQKTSCT